MMTSPVTKFTWKFTYDDDDKPGNKIHLEVHLSMMMTTSCLTQPATSENTSVCQLKSTWLWLEWQMNQPVGTNPKHSSQSIIQYNSTQAVRCELASSPHAQETVLTAANAQWMKLAWVLGFVMSWAQRLRSRYTLINQNTWRGLIGHTAQLLTRNVNEQPQIAGLSTIINCLPNGWRNNGLKCDSHTLWSSGPCAQIALCPLPPSASHSLPAQTTYVIGTTAFVIKLLICFITKLLICFVTELLTSPSSSLLSLSLFLNSNGFNN